MNVASRGPNASPVEVRTGNHSSSVWDRTTVVMGFECATCGQHFNSPLHLRAHTCTPTAIVDRAPQRQCAICGATQQLLRCQCGTVHYCGKQHQVLAPPSADSTLGVSHRGSIGSSTGQSVWPSPPSTGMAASNSAAPTDRTASGPPIPLLVRYTRRAPGSVDKATSQSWCQLAESEAGR